MTRSIAAPDAVADTGSVSDAAAGDPAPALVALVTTVGSADDARRLADTAVAQRLAACVQIEAIQSAYRWQGAVHHDTEWRLWFKTTAAALPRARAWLTAAHPYELPAIFLLDLAAPSAAFADWVRAETSAPDAA